VRAPAIRGGVSQLNFKSAILAGALALVAFSAHAAAPNEAASNDPAMGAINTAIDLTKSQQQAQVYNCPQPATVKPDTCSIPRSVAERSTRTPAISQR
jgi:hypothetical protein